MTKREADELVALGLMRRGTFEAYERYMALTTHADWARAAGLRDREEREAPVPEIPGMTYSGTKIGPMPIYFDPNLSHDSPTYMIRSDLFTQAPVVTFDPGPCVWPIR